MVAMLIQVDRCKDKDHLSDSITYKGFSVTFSLIMLFKFCFLSVMGVKRRALCLQALGHRATSLALETRLIDVSQPPHYAFVQLQNKATRTFTEASFTKSQKLPAAMT